MKHILVTGCCGFVGSHLCEALLANGYEVTGVDNFDPFYSKEVKLKNLAEIKAHKHFTFFETDLRQSDFYSAFSHLKFDAVIHLAAKAGVQPSLAAATDYITSNITATTHLLDFMRANGISKMLFTSSSSVYGNNTSIPFREEDAVNEPLSPYAFTKRSCELLLHTYHHLYQLDVICLRLFTVIGPRQRPDLAIHKFVELISNDKPIKMYGDGSTARDYTFVADTVAGYIGALEYLLRQSGVYEIVNLGNNTPVKLNVLIDIIANELGRQPQIVQEPQQPGDAVNTYADITKAQKLFSYKPTTDVADGVKEFIKWYTESK